MKKTLIGYFRSQTAITGLALGVMLPFLALPALAGKGGSKGKPGDGGGEDPPPNPAPVEYQLTWIPGINGGLMNIYDCNTAGIAVGSYQDETGTTQPFWTTADGVINPLDHWWTLPPGYEDWRVGAGMRINEGNLVCGVLRNEPADQEQLFLANLLDPDSLEVFGPVERTVNMSWAFMNEHGDVTWMTVVEGNITTLRLYVRSLDKSFSLMTGERTYWPTGINDNLQISAHRKDFTGDFYSSPTYRGAALLTFGYDAATEVGTIDIEPLGAYAETWADPLLLPWGGLNNAGDVFGSFETKVRKTFYRNRRLVSRVADATAGLIAADSATWTELDAGLPVGGAQANPFSFAAASCALDVNEFGQIVGGYNAQSSSAEDLWLLDPVDGLLDVDNLVVGDPAEVESFRAANGFRFVRITQLDPETGYGIISGAASYSGPGFILTPRLIEQP